MLADEPTSQDRLDYKDYNEIIVEILNNPYQETPFTMGIFGNWGSGKTSLMRMVEKVLTENIRNNSNNSQMIVLPVWFNPWMYVNEDHLIIPFLHCISDQIKKNLDVVKRGGLKPKTKLPGQLNNLATALMCGLKGEVSMAGAKITIDPAESLRYLNERKKRYESIYYDINGLLKKIVESASNLRIAVFLDDLDRCMPEKAVEMIEGIKLFLHVPGFFFIIGIDKDVIEKGIAVRYDMSNQNVLPSFVKEYLDKMIQFPFHLPLIHENKLQDFIEELLKSVKSDYLNENAELARYSKLIVSSLKKNPREYKRFINVLNFYLKVANKKHFFKNKKLTIEQIFKWVLITMKHSDFIENEVKHNKLIISELQEEYEKSLKYKIEQAEGKHPLDSNYEPKKGYLSKWIYDDRLMNIIKLDKGCNDKGFPLNDESVINHLLHFFEATPVRSQEESAKNSPDIANIDWNEIVTIQESSFLVGSEDGIRNERPAIEVRLSTFCIGKFPITNKQYKEFLDDSGYDPTVSNNFLVHWGQWQNGYPHELADHPVCWVNWDDAQAYCNWRRSKENKEYRLPTEVEWERSARGVDSLRFPWGNEFEYSKCNTLESGEKRTTPVNKYEYGVSSDGCYDMAGNVHEWCADWYDENYYRQLHDSGRPISDPKGPDIGTMRVVKGGTWNKDKFFAPCSRRFQGDPGRRYSIVGFRVAISPESE